MSVQKPPECINDDAGDSNMESYVIKDLGDSMFETSFHVARALYGGLIGQRGMTKKRLESASSVKITIPGHRDKGKSLISIKGETEQDVCTARKKIESLVASLRMKTRPTHFTCVPACTDEMKKVFTQIKEDIISDGFPGIDELLFIDVGKIHITFAPCCLLDEQDRQKAVDVFQECSQDFVDKKLPIEVTVRGLRKFDDEVSTSVRVLFGGIHSPDLQAFADKVLQRFKKVQLNSEDYGDTAKLHMTIMNVHFRTKVDPEKPRRFDATDLLKKYADYDFGTFLVNEIHLSEMGTSDENGFYKALHKVSI